MNGDGTPPPYVMPAASGLLAILRSGVAIANTVTRSLQALVSYERHIGTDGYGSDMFAPAVPLHALIDWKQHELRTSTGLLTVSRVAITLLDITEINNATNGEGINDDDRFTCPDGTTGPILDMGGFIDAGTGHPLATDVYLG